MTNTTLLGNGSTILACCNDGEINTWKLTSKDIDGPLVVKESDMMFEPSGKVLNQNNRLIII